MENKDIGIFACRCRSETMIIRGLPRKASKDGRILKAPFDRNPFETTGNNGFHGTALGYDRNWVNLSNEWST